MNSTCFSVAKAYFMCLSFLCDHSLRFFLFAKPVFCFSVFYAITVFAFSYSQSLFSVSQFFIRQRFPLFLIRKAHFVCFSVFFLFTFFFFFYLSISFFFFFFFY